ncbi:C5-sterol desaturase [Calocera viscosa TUFC12733]|uniref:C5-sterol desaturase n=1 Tax=Calocera viscosa (strain TUFC12733) TaxID=1330018 RepID=A0A167QYX3_CALVF|nr:C5-sterol desaturase [Calocera viscosa TUFC12733]
MDVILEFADYYVLDALYAKYVPADPLQATSALSALSNASLPLNASSPDPLSAYLPQLGAPSSAWAQDHIGRQILSLSVLTIIGINLLYFLFAYPSYAFIFDHRLKQHPRYLPNQIALEIRQSVGSFPGMLVLMLPWFMAEVRGYSRLYDRVDEYGWTYLVLSVPLFLLFTDYCIYWIHRGLHHPIIYKYIHKPHHKWIVPTPFASHAFHPLDGTAQGMPYHFAIFLFPVQRHLYLGLFIFVNVWTILIHDGDMIVDHPLLRFINGPAHHTLHHIYFTVNYGQYFTWADWVGGSFMQPGKELDPLNDALANMKKKAGKAQ